MMRLVIALGVGLAVSAIAVVSAWLNWGDIWYLQPERKVTGWQLEGLDKAIAEYRKKMGRLPASLAQLRQLEDLAVPYDYQKDGVFRDSWDRPIRYTTEGESYTVLSYGRDGKPGGRGPDCDLTNQDLRPRGSFPTIGQFLFMRSAEGMLLACLGGGALAFLTALVTIRGPDLSRAGWASLAVKLGVTMLAATLVAGVMSALEVPTGH